MSRCSARVTSCVSRTEQRGEINTMKKPKFPKVSLILMIFFTVAGVIMMMIPDLPRNVFGLDATTFIVGTWAMCTLFWPACSTPKQASNRHSTTKGV